MKQLSSECCYPKKKETIRRALVGRYTSEVHYDLDAFIGLVEAFGNKVDEAILAVPYCSTVEVENLGALVSFDTSNMPLVKVDQGLDLSRERRWSYGFDKGRMALLLDLPRAYGGHKKLALKVAGPMTVVSAVMNMGNFFKSARKDEGFKIEFVETMAQNIFLWIYRAECAGYHMVSLADPAGTLELLGERTFRMMAQVYQRSFALLQEKGSSIPIYLCPILSKSLFDQGIIIRSKKQELRLQLISGSCFEKYVQCEDIELMCYCLNEK